MRVQQLATLVQQVRQIAIKAGKKIMTVYEQDFEVMIKKDNSPLTTADLASHNYIIAALAKLSPKFPILSEESTDIPFSERSKWHTYWLIDPLDGTKSFVKRKDEFCVCIALIQNHNPILGVINSPVEKKTYYASHHNGAFLEDQPIQARSLPEIPVIYASRFHTGKKLTQYLKKIAPYKLLSLSSALKACRIAEGKVDLQARLWPTSEWDTAASQCILEEAGGQLTTTDMQAMRYNTKASLLNPYFFAFGKNSKNWQDYL